MKINHVGLIADGNRRWAKEHGKGYLDAYKITMVRISEFIEFTLEEGIPIISIYLLSKDNLFRKREDLDTVLETETYLVENLLLPICIKHECKVFWAGDSDIVPKNLKNGLMFCAITHQYLKEQFCTYLLVTIQLMR